MFRMGSVISFAEKLSGLKNRVKKIRNMLIIDKSSDFFVKKTSFAILYQKNKNKIDNKIKWIGI